MKFAALWDLDGVLADSGPYHYTSWAETLARYNVPFTEEHFRATFGMNNTGILKLFLGADTPQRLINRIGDDKEVLFRDLIAGKLQPLPGVAALLTALRQAGFCQVVASSAPQANIDAELDALGLRSAFDAVVSGADLRAPDGSTLPGKPHPAVFLAAARAAGVPPAQCLVFEDSVAGVQAARAAGMACIAITNTNPAAALSAASLVVDSLEGITLEGVEEIISHQLSAVSEQNK